MQNLSVSGHIKATENVNNMKPYEQISSSRLEEDSIKASDMHNTGTKLK